jgi:hypothetical protein
MANIERTPRAAGFPGRQVAEMLSNTSCSDSPSAALVSRCTWALRIRGIDVITPAMSIDPVSSLQTSLNFTVLVR